MHDTLPAYIDGIAHGLAVAVIEAVQALAADLTPEDVQQAAEARAVAEGHPDPTVAARAALWACVQALKALRKRAERSHGTPTFGATETEGGEL